ncbi:hypothetical protein N2152v2_002907 [Parachlorella kessleri]
MVLTRRSSALQQTFPLLHALVAGDAARIAATCTQQEAAKCGPGNLSALMLAIVLDWDPVIPHLIAAQVPLDAKLTHSYSEAQVQKWLAAAQLTDRAVLRQELVAGQSALDMALSLNKPHTAAVLVAAGACLQPLLYEHRFTPYQHVAVGLVREQVRHYALAQSWNRGLCNIPAALLGQLSLLAVQLGQLEHCLTLLQAAVYRSVQLSLEEADALMREAASKGHYPRLLVLRALQADQPAAALAVLQAVEAAQQQRQEETQQHQQQQQPPTLRAEHLSELLISASAKGFLVIVMQLLQMGADIWPVLEQLPATASGASMEKFMHPTVAAVLLPQLAERYAAGSLQMSSSEQLALLLRCLSLSNQVMACLKTLHVAAARQLVLGAEEAAIVLKAVAKQGQPAIDQQQASLTAEDTYEALSTCVRLSNSTELAKVALAVGAPLSRNQASSLAQRAAHKDQAAMLELLLTAGAAVDTQLATAVVYSLSLACLRLLLKRGPLPVDSSVWTKQWLRQYTCPVLFLLELFSERKKDDTRPLRMLEALLAAGHRPTVYRNVVMPYTADAQDLWDPLKENLEDFPRNGAARWLHLALDSTGWSPATHWQHPPQLHRAFRTVLLAGAQGRRGQVEQEQHASSFSAQRHRLAATGLRFTEAGSRPSSGNLLAQLPTEVLLHIMHLAARPLSAWLALEKGGDAADDDDEEEEDEEEEEEEEDY